MSAEGQTIGIYGGAFDPPHVGHVLVGCWALATGTIDALWIVPTGGHPFGKRMAPFADRAEMCRLAFAPLGERAVVHETERGPGPHYSIETLARLREAHPGLRWRWVMGTDTLETADKWRAWDRLQVEAPPLLIPRAGHQAEAAWAAMNLDANEAAARAAIAVPDVSSTDVRRHMTRGARPAKLLVPGPVLDYTEQRGLYREDAG